MCLNKPIATCNFGIKTKLKQVMSAQRSTQLAALSLVAIASSVFTAGPIRAQFKPNIGRPGFTQPLSAQVLALSSAPQVGLIGALEVRNTKDERGQVLCRVWNEKGNPLWQKPIPGSRVYAMAFGRQGKVVAVGGVGTQPWMEQRRSAVTNRGTVRVFDAKSGRLLRSFPVVRNGYIHSIAVAPRAPILAVAGQSWIHLWDYSARRQLASLPMDGEVTSLSFSPDGKLLASASLWSAPTVWDVAQRKVAFTLPRQGGQTFGVTFSPTGKVLALAGASFLSSYDTNGKRLWNREEYIGFDPTWHDARNTLTYSRDGRWLIAGATSSVVLNPQGKLLAAADDVAALRFGQNSLWGLTKSGVAKWPSSVFKSGQG